MSSTSPRHRAGSPRHRLVPTAPPPPEGGSSTPVARRIFPAAALATGAVVGARSMAAAESVVGPDIAGLSSTERHLLRRLSYGINGRMAGEVRNAGGARQWFASQLDADSLEDFRGDEIANWYPKLHLTPQQQWGQFRTNQSCGNSVIADDLARYTLMMRAYSSRQVLEVMTEFWSNLFHVPAPFDKCWPHRADYDRTIRANALGRFDTLLEAAVLHPAMLLYLDNFESTKDAPNENLGREILECHTVGITADYTEHDVLDSTRILTGWAVDHLKTWQGFYNAEGHYRGPVRVMDFTDANANPNGQATTSAYLRYLAHHPATAQRIATKLVTRFVSDRPSPTLVAAVADAFTSSGTDIRQTLLALINHPEFYSGAKDKVRTPSEDFVATVRALRMLPDQPRHDDDLASFCVWISSAVGQRPFDWPTPDGIPDSGEAWASTARMLGSWTMHQSLARAHTPGAEDKPLEFWLPDLPVRFDELVGFVCRRLLFQNPTPTVVTAACESVGMRPTDVVTPKSRFIIDRRIQLLVSCLLDSPLHMNH